MKTEIYGEKKIVTEGVILVKDKNRCCCNCEIYKIFTEANSKGEKAWIYCPYASFLHTHYTKEFDTTGETDCCSLHRFKNEIDLNEK